MRQECSGSYPKVLLPWKICLTNSGKAKNRQYTKGNKMPLTKKGKKIIGSMTSQYGAKKGEEVFYASANKGAIKGVHARKAEQLRK